MSRIRSKYWYSSCGDRVVSVVRPLLIFCAGVATTGSSSAMGDIIVLCKIDRFSACIVGGEVKTRLRDCSLCAGARATPGMDNGHFNYTFYSKHMDDFRSLTTCICTVKFTNDVVDISISSVSLFRLTTLNSLLLFMACQSGEYIRT